MQKLFKGIQAICQKNDDLPFSIYSSVHVQNLLNVPIAKPLLIIVLSGNKQLGPAHELICDAGQFVFLSDSSTINMRNVPDEKSYHALLIEFEYEDFLGLVEIGNSSVEFITGEVVPKLQDCLLQFIEACLWAPEEILKSRRKEILLLLVHLGYKNLSAMMAKSKLSHKVHDIFQKYNFSDLKVKEISSKLAMSESTLRRKLDLEGTSIKAIKDNARLGLALHLLQTSNNSINLIAEKCGYSSQSRFTARFKKHFGLTPSELRKTKMTDLGD